MRQMWYILVALILTGALDILADSDTNQIVGKLGFPVGTDLTIDGTFKAGKNSWVLVTKVNDKELPVPVLISTANLAYPVKIPTNVVCRFKGVEITYVIKPVLNPKTGEEMQQAASGRHFDFKVTEVVAPVGVKLREDKSPNKSSEATR